MERICVGLVADPAAPTEIARRMTDLSPLDGSDAWDITVVSEPFTTGSEDVGTAVGRLQDHARQRDWDLIVGLTELPLHDRDGRHLLVETDPQQRAAVLSLPALGGLRMHARARRAVRTLISGMADPNANDEHRVTLPRLRGRGRLLLGMVLANRPWAVGARVEVCVRRRVGDRRGGHHQLHGLAPGELAVLVAPGCRNDRLDRARGRLARRRRRAVGPPG